MNKITSYTIIKYLLTMDLIVFFKGLKNKIIDYGIWVGLTLLIANKLMQAFGMSSTFGIFQFGSLIATAGLFEMNHYIWKMVTDLEGEKTINYRLTLPASSKIIIISKFLFYCTAFFTLEVILFFIGKIFLWNEINFNSINFLLLLPITLLSCIFFSSFLFFIIASVKNIWDMDKVWSRFVFPLWFMGGYQFSWHALYNKFPLIAYINCINPIMYIIEGTRNAIIFDGTQFVNPYICIAAISGFTIICGCIGYIRFKKKLDFV